MTVYAASINTPGYLPEGDPFYSESIADCWSFLADERQRAEDAMDDDELPYSDTLSTLHRKARYAGNGAPEMGTVRGDTPGYQGDHDLGVAYTVDVAPGIRWDDESDSWVEMVYGESEWVPDYEAIERQKAFEDGRFW